MAGGQQIDSAQGSPGQGASVRLRSRKSGTGSASFPLTGSAMALSQGEFTKAATYALSGQSIGASQGFFSDQASCILFFSDLLSGPKSGNTDTSLGQTSGVNGAIVTIWGRGLGNSQGSSTITCCGAAVSYVYYWGPAIPPYSPADFFNGYQNYDCIIFQVPSTAVDGLGTITVTVAGETSNTLPFTVRTGRIFYVATTGNDSTGTGTFTAPYLTMQKVVQVMNVAGDIAYVRNGVNQTASDPYFFGYYLVFATLSGTEAAPIALVAYPGAACTIGTTAGDGTSNSVRGIGFILSPSLASAQWITVAKFSITSGSDLGINGRDGGRFVGNNITCPKMIGSDAAGTAVGDHISYIGNEWHDNGNPLDVRVNTHCIYISGARNVSDWATNLEEDREVSFNYIHDNSTVRAVNIYSQDDGQGSRMLHDTRVHHNLIMDQTGDGILFGNKTGGTHWCYNNVIIRAGLGPVPSDGDTQYMGLNIRFNGTYNIYNNTFIDCGRPSSGHNSSGAVLILNSFSDTNINMHNNIFYQVNTTEPYLAASSFVPSINSAKYSHNLWYGKGAAPVWDTSPTNADPLFANGITDIHLQDGSPAKNVGSTPTSLGDYTFDFVGITQPQEGVYDLGAMEFLEPVDTRPAWVTNLAIGQQYRIPGSSFFSSAVTAQYTILHHPDVVYNTSTGLGGYSTTHNLSAGIHASSITPALFGITAYSGAAYDPTNSILRLYGGGHSAAFGTAVLKFQANAASPGPWTVEKQPTDAMDILYCDTSAHIPPYRTSTNSIRHLDGAPPVGHHSTRAIYLPSDKALWNMGGGVTFTGGWTGIDRLDLDPNSATYRQWSNPSIGTAWTSIPTINTQRVYQDGCLVDYRLTNDRETVYIILNNSGNIYRWGGPDSPLTATSIGSISSVYNWEGVSFYAWPMCIDTLRNKIVIATAGQEGGSNAPFGPFKIITMDCITGANKVVHDIVGCTFPTCRLGYGTSMDYDPDGDRYVVFAQGNGCTFVNPTTFAYNSIAFTGDSLPANQKWWSITRFRYSQELGGTLYVSTGPTTGPTQDGCSVYFVRLR